MQNCYNAGRIPRENMHDPNVKGNAESFQFIKDLAEQNKELKKRIEELEAEHSTCGDLKKYVEESKEKMKQIQELHLKQMDEVNAMIAERQKQETMKLIQEKLDMEEHYKDEIAKLKGQIAKLEKTNQELLLKMDSIVELEEQNSGFKKEIEALKKTILKLEEEIRWLKEKSVGTVDPTVYISQIEELKKKNGAMSYEVSAKSQKIAELEFRLEKLEKELQEVSEDGDKITLIENLKIKVTQMQAERSSGTERERNYEKMIKELQAELEQISERLSLCEVAKHRLYVDYKKLLDEYNKLREKYAMDSQHRTFQDFVQLKRQLNHVKTENDGLKQIAKSVSGSALPVLKNPDSGSKKRTGSYKNGKN